MENPVKSDCKDSRPYRLQNTIQHYPWGTRNDEAFIAHLLGVEPDLDQPFAELWMGVHPNAPSLVIDPEEGLKDLSTWISENPRERLSMDTPDLAGVNLPYLFKVLSADEALSIQAHPNKAQAEQLHDRDDVHYPDDNHKPEVAIAIDYLDALVGFISSERYAGVLKSFPELVDIMGAGPTGPAHLKQGVLKLLEKWKNKQSEVISTIKQIESRLNVKDLRNDIESLFLDQIQKCGNQDIGLLFIFLLNRVQLAAGEAIFLAPGVPHAYLRGNIIECMANSDNVVRLGLTAKFCDSQALSEILVFDEQENYLVETASDGYLTEYLSPTKEFSVKSLNLLQGESRAFSFRTKLTMFLLLDGEVSLHWGDKVNSCTSVYRRGDSFITPANLQSFTLQARNHSKIFIVDIPDIET